MKDLVIIIPLHEYTEESSTLLKRAVESIPDGVRAVVSMPKSLNGVATDDFGGKVSYISESEGTTFADLVNTAVESIGEKWFSILEYDDTYTENWLQNVEKSIAQSPDITVFMFIEDIVEFDGEKYLGFGNVEAWASSFSNNIGYIDNDCLQNYFDFYPTGSVFSTDDWKEIGGLKSLLPLTFWYEWLLRATNKGFKVYVIPKVGYVHRLNRKGSLVETYRNSMTEDEMQFYFDIAKKDYFFKTQKNADEYAYRKEEVK